MSECAEHGKACPYESHEECHEIVRLTRNAFWEADKDIEQNGGNTRHYVQMLIPHLEEIGLRIVRVEKKNMEDQT